MRSVPPCVAGYRLRRGLTPDWRIEIPKYIVYVKSVSITPVEIEAETESEAIHRVVNDEGIDGDEEYSHTLEPDSWTVEEIEDN